MSLSVLVTGANKGIGLEICKALAASKTNYSIIMGSRNLERGKDALETIQKLNKDTRLIQIDLDDSKSMESAKEWIQKENGGKLDILVNNAGMAYKGASKAPFSEQAEVTIKANY